MNQNLFATIGAALLAAAGLSGCAADRTRIPEAIFRDEVRPLPSVPSLTEAEILARAGSQPPTPVAGTGWQPMNDGETLNGWRVAGFSGSGQVECRQGLILLRTGSPFAGINWTNEIPATNYEITLEAMRVAGSDVFCGLTFPVGGSFCSLVVGGSGGSLAGLSDLDSLGASENETTQIINFENGRWYRIRLRVTRQKIQAWIEQKQAVDVTITGRKISLPPGDLDLSKPLGITSRDTTAALREIKIRRINPADMAGTTQ